MKPIRSLIPIILIASFAAVSPAQAQQRMVTYADLDLTSPRGQAALDRRIEIAVRQVCGRVFPSDVQTWYEVRRCRAQTLAAVQAQRNDALAQAHSDRIQLSARR